MNKQELIGALENKTGLDKKNSEKFINAFVEIVSDALADGDKVTLVGFGTFETRERSAREARNPQNGGVVHIPAKVVPAFKAGKGFKEAVNK